MDKKKIVTRMLHANVANKMTDVLTDGHFLGIQYLKSTDKKYKSTQKFFLLLLLFSVVVLLIQGIFLKK